jgi:hypothetical protein
VPPDLGRQIAEWIAAHPGRSSPRAFLFPNSSGHAFSVGNYLKRYLKPLGEKAGIHDLTHQVFRRTSSAHASESPTKAGQALSAAFAVRRRVCAPLDRTHNTGALPVAFVSTRLAANPPSQGP